MSRNVRKLRCLPETVFEVLGDAWLYPSWVVGASRMRDVDSKWPEPGSRLHHSVGVWPLLLNDSTTSAVWEPPHRMVLTARGWPVGEARVVIEVKPHEDGCLVRMQEEAVSGPAKLLPRPMADVLLGWRNAESLHRLAYLAEGFEARSDTSAREEDPRTAEGGAA